MELSTSNVDRHTNFFRNLSIAKKLAAGFGCVLLILVMLVAFVEYKLVSQDTLQNRVVALRVPTNIAGHDLVNGINYSLAALRGYMILGKDDFKLQRLEAWQEIDRNLNIMREMSKSWTVSKNVETLKELTAVMAEFKVAQQQVEDISHSKDEQPAMKMLLTEAAPRAKKIITAITGMINEEKQQQATAERKALLATFADSRGSFAMGLASIRGYLISGEQKWVDDFNERWVVNSARLKTIQKNRRLLTPKQRNHFETYVNMRKQFAPLPSKMFEIRGSSKWNMANYLLGSEAAPWAVKALKILAAMVENQNQLMAADVQTLQQQSTNLKLISLVAAVIALLIGTLVAWFITRMIVSSLAEAITASKRIADGDLSNNIMVNSQDETGQLLQGMKQMQEKLTQVIEKDIQAIIDTAKQGDLTQRINLDDKQGFYKKLSASINELVDINENVVDDTVRMFGAMAKGDLTERIVTDYQGAFNRLKQDANQTVEKLTQVIEGDIQIMVDAAKEGELSQRIELTDKKGFFKTLSLGVNDLVDVNERIINDTVRVIGAMAAGDLTATIDADYQGIFGQLKDNANATQSKLTSIIGDIRKTANSVTAGSSEIAVGTQDLSQRTEEQASALEETAASMEQMATSVRDSATNAASSADLALEAKGVAVEGGEVVNEAIIAMDTISKSSKKIDDIISVIDDIAFQTNLLALNAAVEAARAGEQGRGFAVVAGEVRNLALRSSSAAKDIKALIQDSGHKVSEGTSLVNKAGGILTTIVTAVTKVTESVSGISVAAQEQSSGIEEVNNAVTQMDEMTQQNAALVEETSSASQLMSDQAREMTDLMSFFQIKGTNTGTVKNSSHRNQPLQINSNMRQTSHAINHDKPVVPLHAVNASEGDDWSEF